MKKVLGAVGIIIFSVSLIVGSLLLPVNHSLPSDGNSTLIADGLPGPGIPPLPPPHKVVVS